MTKAGKELKVDIKDYVDGWYWDDDSKKYAYEMGKFLFSFIDYLEDQKLSERTKRNHHDNIALIGMFEAGYGYNEKFCPENLEGGPNYLYEFERKVNDSRNAIQSYKSTWRKLDKYIKSGEYKKYLKQIEDKLKKEHSG